MVSRQLARVGGAQGKPTTGIGKHGKALGKAFSDIFGIGKPIGGRLNCASLLVSCRFELDQ